MHESFSIHFFSGVVDEVHEQAEDYAWFP
jgi:hypothetical protein